jgi:hypothetical protein
MLLAVDVGGLFDPGQRCAAVHLRDFTALHPIMSDKTRRTPKHLSASNSKTRLRRTVHTRLCRNAGCTIKYKCMLQATPRVNHGVNAQRSIVPPPTTPATLHFLIFCIQPPWSELAPLQRVPEVPQTQSRHTAGVSREELESWAMGSLEKVRRRPHQDPPQRSRDPRRWPLRHRQALRCAIR